MIVNEKALVRGMKEAYKGSGYTVLVRANDTWVIYCGYWAAIIDGQSNVPNEVLSLIVLHMGFLPGMETAYRVFKTDTGPAIQEEVYAVADETISKLEASRMQPDKIADIQQTKLMLRSYRVWQQEKDLKILLIDPKYESIMDSKLGVRSSGDAIFQAGGISCVYVMRVKTEANNAQIEHLSQMQWVTTK